MDNLFVGFSTFDIVQVWSRQTIVLKTLHVSQLFQCICAKEVVLLEDTSLYGNVFFAGI